MAENQTPTQPLSQTPPATPAPPKSKKKLWIIISVVAALIIFLFAGCIGGTYLYFWYQKNQAEESVKSADKAITEAEKQWNNCNKALFPQEDNPDLNYQANLNEIGKSVDEGEKQAKDAKDELERIKDSGASASFKEYANLKIKTCDNLIDGFGLMKKESDLIKTKVAQDKFSAYLDRHNAGIDTYNASTDLGNKGNYSAAQPKAQESVNNMQQAQKYIDEAYQLDKTANLSELITANQKQTQASQIALEMTKIGGSNITRYNELVGQSNSLTKEANAIIGKESNNFGVLSIAYADKIDKVQSKVETYYNQIKGFDDEAEALKKSKLKLK